MKQSPIIASDHAALPAFSRLCAEDLCVSIDGRPVLSNLSLQVEQGEAVGLLGRDGAGKTSCFQALAGLMRVDSGRIMLNGADLTQMPADRRARLGLSYLPEEVCIFRGLTAAENIEIALETRGLGAAEQSRELERLLTSFGLECLRDQRATTLSGGERRRCEVARAMATRPLILMLDEPFRGLDPMSVREVREVVSQLKREEVGVLISDYDLHDMLELIDRAYVIHDGRAIFSGTPAALLDDPEVRHLYLGESFSL
jgi:lipopolysaccharide export system ATP-binding protein